MAFDYSSWTPSWWQGGQTIPTTVPSTSVEFLEAANQLMPYMSPQDMARLGMYLYAQQPKVFTGYAPQNIQSWAPPRLTKAQEKTLYSPDRYTQAQNYMFGDTGTAGKIDPDSPVRQWLQNIMATGQQYGPQNTRAQRRTVESQLSDLLGSPQSYGVDETGAALWKPWLQSFVAPTTKKMQWPASSELPWAQASSWKNPAAGSTTRNKQWW